MGEEQTPGIEVLWYDHRNFKQSVQTKFDALDRDIDDLRSYLSELDKKMDVKFDNFDQRVDQKFVKVNEKLDTKLDTLNASINQVTGHAINAMPKWAVDAADRKNLIINGLFVMLAAALTAFASVIYLHK